MNPAGSKYQTSSYCCHVYARWMGNFGHASNDPYRSRSHPNKTSPHLHSKFARNVLMIRVRAGSVGIGGGGGNGAGRLLCVYTRRGQESVNRKRRVDCCILHATCFDTGCGLMRVMIVYVARFSNPPIPIQISFIHHGFFVVIFGRAVPMKRTPTGYLFTHDGFSCLTISLLTYFYANF